MSKIYNQVVADLKQAMLNKDSAKVIALRNIKTAFDLSKNEKNAKEFDDVKAVQVLTSLKKQRNDSIELFTKGNRPELVAKEEAESVIISEYLPSEVSEEQLIELVKDSIASMSAPNMNIIIKDVKSKLQILNLIADGAKLSNLVKSSLNN